MNQDIEMVDLYGVKDGREVHLGQVPMTPKMKAKEIVRSYFGNFEDDGFSDGCMALYACEELIEFMKKQGWKAPDLVVPA